MACGVAGREIGGAAGRWHTKPNGVSDTQTGPELMPVGKNLGARLGGARPAQRLDGGARPAQRRDGITSG